MCVKSLRVSSFASVSMSFCLDFGTGLMLWFCFLQINGNINLMHFTGDKFLSDKMVFFHN